MPQINIPISGMHCKSCELLVEKNLQKIVGVVKVSASSSRSQAVVVYNDQPPSETDLKKAVKEAGYEYGENQPSGLISNNWSDYKNLILGGIILYLLYQIFNWFGVFDISVNTTENAGPGIALLVGLVAGVSTCMALVGGLVLSLSARHAKLHPEATTIQKFRPHLYFNLGRIIGYGLLGGLIGLLGAVLKPSIIFLSIMTVIIGVIMLFLGLKLIGIFPILNNYSITLPTFIAKFFGFNKDVKEYSHKISLLTGALTFFLPCGFTQAMQLLAVSTGSFFKGALVMSLFAVGTAPGLLGMGGLSSILKGKKAKIFFVAVGLLVILLGWYNIKSSLVLFSGFNAKIPNDNSIGTVETKDYQIVYMTQDFNGYSPEVLRIKKGQPVKWIINSTAPFSCASSLVVPKYKITKQLKQGENIIEFTPTILGEIPFSCSMGMFRGKFIVIE